MYYIGIKYARYAQRARKKQNFRHLPYTIPNYVEKHKSQVLFDSDAFTILKFKKSENVVLAIEDNNFNGHTERRERPSPDDVW